MGRAAVYSDESVPIDESIGRRHPMVVFGDHKLCAGSRLSVQPMPSPHMHSQVEINFLLSGAMTYWFDRRVFRLEAGRLAIFWGMMPHQVTEAASETRFVCLYLPLSMLLSLPSAGRLRDAILNGAFLSADNVRPWESEPFLRWRQELLDGDERRAELVRDELSARLRRLDLEGWSRLDDQTPLARVDLGPDAGRFARIEAMTRFIAEQARGDIRVEDVAKAAGLHPNYAMDLFRRALGLTIKQAITRQRLDAAQSMLIATDASIATIAFDCGFGSLSSFYEAFEKRFAVSPAGFRQAATARAG